MIQMNPFLFIYYFDCNKYFVICARLLLSLYCYYHYNYYQAIFYKWHPQDFLDKIKFRWCKHFYWQTLTRFENLTSCRYNILLKSSIMYIDCHSFFLKAHPTPPLHSTRLAMFVSTFSSFPHTLQYHNVGYAQSCAEYKLNRCPADVFCPVQKGKT